MNTKMNANEVLWAINNLIDEGEVAKHYGYSKKWRISDVCDQLSIFDWWNEYLSMTQLKQMRNFLTTAIDLGFDGYVCFKVGAAGCSHGMWAHKEESTDGYSPRTGACLFHSFRSGDNYWDLRQDDGNWIHSDDKYEFTLSEIKTYLN